MTYLVTGGAGFIGSHVCETLLQRGERVVAVDNFNDYYDPQRKRRYIEPFINHPQFTLWEGDICDEAAMQALFEQHRPRRVAHLAARAGPRPSVQHPMLYETVNIGGTVNLLNQAVTYGVEGFLLASTSSVYGLSPTPWTEDTPTDRPLSPYAATKKGAEVLAYTYAYQHHLPIRVVRFFTVYGPRGRPDMTPTVFVDRMLAGQPITLYNGGIEVYRDWTYVDDIVNGVLAALDSDLPYEILNLGNSQPVELRAFVQTLERVTGLSAIIDAQPLPAADPPRTYANTDKAGRLLGWEAHTDYQTGLERFWAWYRDFLKLDHV